MPAELVRIAIEESKSRDVLVRATALLCGSRVLAAVDQAAARQAFAEGLELAESLPLLPRQLAIFLDEAVRLGAAADPPGAVRLYRCLPATLRRMAGHTGTVLVQEFASRGDFEAALDLLEDLSCEAGGAQIVVHLAADPAIRLRAITAARERWRVSKGTTGHGRDFLIGREYHHLFGRHWRILPQEYQEVWLNEILEAIESEPVQPTNARFGDRVELRSISDMHLFEVLGALRELKTDEQAAAILRAHPDVEEAAKIYPRGMDSLLAELRPGTPRADTPMGMIGGGVGFGGRDAAMIQAMVAAHHGDSEAVPQMLAEAHRKYMIDMDPDDPNLAPRTFWPSCHAYKTAAYWSGRLSGTPGMALVEAVPDTDFAILATIELAAGVLGLKEHAGVRSERHPGGKAR